MRRVLTPNKWLLGALLVALIIRSLIPAGFMPATDRPFSFQICPDGYPAHLLRSAADGTHAEHHRHHPASDAGDSDTGNSGGAGGENHRHSSAGSEHCVFAAAAGAGPLAWAPVAFFAPAVALEAPEFFYASPTLPPLSFRVQQPRGPPALS
jgi:hypothetical protein